MGKRIVMWVSVVVVGVCVLHVSAVCPKRECSDHQSCSINPTHGSHFTASGHSRQPRSAFPQGVRNSRFVQDEKQEYMNPRYSKFVKLTSEEDTEDESGTTPQRKYSKFSNSEPDETKQSTGLPPNQKITEGMNKEIPETPHFAKAKFCPYCKQMLPPDPMDPQQPIDARTFPHQNPQHLVNPISQPHVAQIPEEYLNQHLIHDTLSPAVGQVKQTDDDVLTMPNSNVAFNPPSYHVPAPATPVHHLQPAVVLVAPHAHGNLSASVQPAVPGPVAAASPEASYSGKHEVAILDGSDMEKSGMPTNKAPVVPT